MKQHWEIMHECRLSDVYFWLRQIWAIKLLLRKHPSDPIGDLLRLTVLGLKKALARSVAGYEKIYGDKPAVAAMRREVEVE